MSFMTESLEMGLTTIDSGLYEYKDRYSSVWYEILRGITNPERLPVLGIFTGNHDTDIENRRYVGNVTDQYKFFGNAAAIDAVKDSIVHISTNNVKNNIHENVRYTTWKTSISSELLIINEQTVPSENGTVVPMITIDNSYDGTKAAVYSFGFGIVDNHFDLIGSISFKKKILGMRQIHIQHSRTALESSVGGYIDVFNNNITDLVNENFERIIPPEDAMQALKMIEETGKRRYAKIVTNLAGLVNNGNDIDEGNIPPINAWNMFMAIATYSCKEKNINMKKMLDSIAERTLNIPTRMLAALR